MNSQVIRGMCNFIQANFNQCSSPRNRQTNPLFEVEKRDPQKIKNLQFLELGQRKTQRHHRKRSEILNDKRYPYNYGKFQREEFQTLLQTSALG